MTIQEQLVDQITRRVRNRREYKAGMTPPSRPYTQEGRAVAIQAKEIGRLIGKIEKILSTLRRGGILMRTGPYRRIADCVIDLHGIRKRLYNEGSALYSLSVGNISPR